MVNDSWTNVQQNSMCLYNISQYNMIGCRLHMVLKFEPRLVWIALILLTMIFVTTHRLDGQTGITGQIVDATERPLPFVVVTSRTRNGFFSAYTDMDGRFDFRDRPHRRGDIIAFRSAGYAPRSVRLEAGGGDIAVTLDSASQTEPTEWRIGLAVEFRLQLLTADGLAVDDLGMLRVGDTYGLRIMPQGYEDCSRAGPSTFEMRGTHVVVAVAVFVRSRECGANIVLPAQVFEMIFDEVGPGSIRVVGRYEDVVLPIFVAPGQGSVR